MSFLSSRPPRSNYSLHSSYVLFCDGDRANARTRLNLWCWNFFQLHKSLMHIHKFMSAFIKSAAHSNTVHMCSRLSDQLPASKHQLNVKWGHKLLDFSTRDSLMTQNNREDITDHLFPSRPVLWLSVRSNTCMSSRHKPPVGRLLSPSFTSSIFIILLPNDLQCFYCCCRKPQFVSTLDKHRTSTAEKLKFVLYSHVQDFYWDLLIDFCVTDPCTPRTSRQGRASPGHPRGVAQPDSVKPLVWLIYALRCPLASWWVPPMSSRLLLLIGTD